MPPDESLEYVGDQGDRLQMMLHLPINQCLFYALATGDLVPLIEAIENTRRRPRNAQWVQFLRSHDDLPPYAWRWIRVGGADSALDRSDPRPHQPHGLSRRRRERGAPPRRVAKGTAAPRLGRPRRQLVAGREAASSPALSRSAISWLVISRWPTSQRAQFSWIEPRTAQGRTVRDRSRARAAIRSCASRSREQEQFDPFVAFDVTVVPLKDLEGVPGPISVLSPVSTIRTPRRPEMQ